MAHACESGAVQLGTDGWARPRESCLGDELQRTAIANAGANPAPAVIHMPVDDPCKRILLRNMFAMKSGLEF